MRQIITSFRFLRDSGQVEPGDMDIHQEEILIRQLINGDTQNIKSCLELLIKDNLRKAKLSGKQDGSIFLLFRVFQSKVIGNAL